MCDIAIGANITERCNTSQGGLEEFYPFPFVKDAFTVADGIATAMSASLTEAFKYFIKGDANTLTQDSVTDNKTGNTVVTQTLANQIYQIDGTTNDELSKFAKSKTSGILKDYKGNYHWVGAEQGFNITSTIQSITGGARNDFNGYNMTLVAENKDFAPILDASTVTAFLAIVTA